MSEDRAAAPDARAVCACRARREWLARAAGAAVATCVPILPVPAFAAAVLPPAKAPAAVGDELAFGSWENDGRVVTPADVVLDAAPLLVYPRDPASGTVREKSRLNQILVLRLDPARLDARTRERAADGVIAYSAICTHAACAVSEWNADKRHLVCPCHSSEYDPAAGASHVAGPAPRALPALPLKREGDKFVIAGPFSAALGSMAQ